MWNLNLADKSPGSDAVVPIRVPDMDAGEAAMLDVARQLNLMTSEMRLVTDGQIRRCPESGRGKGDDAGWYVAHEFRSVVYGWVGNWRRSDWVRFTSREEGTLSEEFRRERQIREQESRAAFRELQRQKGREVAVALLNLPPADPAHPYLKRKGVKPHGILQDGNLLVVPVCDIDGNVISRQTIPPQGKKLFAKDCVGVGMCVIGGPTDHVVICEGFATGASIHEATGLRVYVTFSASNIVKLSPEIAALEAQNGASVVIAGDYDKPDPMTGKRAGVEAAQAAAAALGAAPIMPKVEGEDWNDVALREPRELMDAFKGLQQLFPDWEPTSRETLKARDWLYARHYIRRYLSLTVAPGGLGKSLLVMTEAIAMATGRDLLGVKPKKRLRVCYYNAEDPMDEIRLRVAAICKHHGIPEEELRGWFFADSGRRAEPLIIAGGTPATPNMTTLNRLKAIVRKRKADVLILDPLANMHDAEETNEAYRTILRPILDMAEAEGFALEIVHHTTKLYGNEARVENSRGGSSLLAGSRAARAINGMSDEEAARLRSEDIKRFLFRVDADGKASMAPMPEHADWYRRVPINVECAAGEVESVASVEPWEPPDIGAGLTKDHARTVRDRLDEMENKPGPRQVVKLIAEVIDDDEAVAKHALKLWLKSGVLRERSEFDKRQGKEMTKIHPGPNDPGVV